MKSIIIFYIKIFFLYAFANYIPLTDIIMLEILKFLFLFPRRINSLLLLFVISYLKFLFLLIAIILFDNNKYLRVIVI